MRLTRHAQARDGVGEQRLGKFFDVHSSGHDFHSSYARRVKLQNMICRPDEAEADMKDAIEIATWADDIEAAEKYKAESPGRCWEEFQKQECLSDTAKANCPPRP